MSVCINCCIGKVDNNDEEEEWMDMTESISPRLPTNAPTTIPALALATSVTVEVYNTEYSLAASVGESSPIVTLRVHSSEYFSWRVPPSRHAPLDLLRIFGHTPLTKLMFAEDCGNFTAKAWMKIFNGFLLLEMLHLYIEGTSKTAFAGFANATPVPGSSVPCPRLREVDVWGHFSEKALKVTLQCLHDRAAKGHRLAMLLMEVDGDKSETALFETNYFPQLRELATEVGQPSE